MGVHIIPAINALGSLQEEQGSVSARSSLSAQERIFCDVFVANGGKAGEAARAAGYADASADVSACKLLCRERVASYIHQLCSTFAHSTLPVAIRALVDIASDPEALRKDRIKAAACLLEHGGMAAPKGGVQVNVGVAVNGQQAQQIIASVHEARAQRLSDIPPAMPDTLQQDLKQLEQLADGLAGDPPGGVQLQGPPATSCSIPVPSPTESPGMPISWSARDVEDWSPDPTSGSLPIDEFRSAFDADEGQS